MVKYWYIGKDFLEARKSRIGASDIPALVPNPEKPNESLAGYGRTPITVWQEKTGRIERSPAGLPAEMGHYLEPKAIELFIREFGGREMAKVWYRDRMIYELNRETMDQPTAQPTPYRHNVQFYRDGMICPPDAVHEPEDRVEKIVSGGMIVHTQNPFLVEAKARNYWAVKRRDESVVSGYDFDNSTWQGVPLKDYMQVQFQLALMEVDRCYLSLIHNTNEWHMWEIRANRSHQNKLIDLAGRMVKCIETDTAPFDLAMNTADIMALYPKVGDDFVIVNGDERAQAIKISEKFLHHDRQAKAHKEKAEEALDAMAAMLKDRPEIRDDEGAIAKWQFRKASEAVMALTAIKDTNPTAYKYLARHDLLTERASGRRVVVKYKGE